MMTNRRVISNDYINKNPIKVTFKRTRFLAMMKYNF